MSAWTDISVQRALAESLGASASEANPWLNWLSSSDAELVKLRLSGSRWKPICWRFGIGRATAHRRWKASLKLIAHRLNETS
jgi:hypothetical protein